MADLTVTVHPSTDPSAHGCYLIGSDITGDVIYKGSTGGKHRYKRITVSLVGKVDVYFFLPGESDTVRHFRESDVFYQAQMILWEADSTSGSLPAGENKFPFSFPLVLRAANKHLPASVESKDGRIRYTVEAKLIRDVENEIEAAVAYSRIPVKGIVEINRSDLLVPRAVQNERVVSQCCFSGGMLSVIASTPRSGYCVGKDGINVTVKVESDNAKKLNSITVSLIKKTACYAQGQPSISTDVLATKVNNRLPRGGVSFSWNVPAIEVPETDCTLTNCSIMHITYSIRTSFTGRCMNQQNLNLPLILGNVPLRKESLEATCHYEFDSYRPSLTASVSHYEPPPIPFMTSSTTQSTESDGDDEYIYEEPDRKLLT